MVNDYSDIKIVAYYWGGDLWGPEEPNTEIDVGKSVEAYEKTLGEYLREQFPGAVVEIKEKQSLSSCQVFPLELSQFGASQDMIPFVNDAIDRHYQDGDWIQWQPM